MKTNHSCTNSRTPRGQRGTMLIIALIVLVAMTLAGIAMMRSVDTGTMVAGNIAFRQAAVNAADAGVQVAFNWLSNNAGGAVLNSDSNSSSSSSAGYFSSASTTEPDWTDASNWTNAALVNAGAADAAGNVIYYRIDRMCVVSNCAPNATCNMQVNICGSTVDTSSVTGSGEGVEQSAPNFFTQQPATHYRVTVRAVGPRNSVSVVQTMMRTQ